MRLVTPDRAVAQDLGPTTSAVGLRDLVRQGVGFECFQELAGIGAAGNRRVALLRHVLTGEIRRREVDHVVVENGPVPMEALYHELKPLSRNRGQLDQAAMVEGRGPLRDLQEGAFHLARIGDAVAGRNIHAALYDALRICKDF